VKPGRPVRRPSGALVALAALGLLAMPRPAQAIDDELLGALKRVQAVRIEGNRAIKDGAIRKVIKTGAGSFLGLRSLPLYRPDFLRSDAITIRNLYARRGYLDASVAAQADSGNAPGHVIVTYTITEGPLVRVRSLDFDTTAALPPNAVRNATRLRAGQPYDPVQLALDRSALAERFADDGYFPTITSEVKRESLSVDIHYAIATGPEYRVRSLTVAGVREVDSSAVRREVLLAPNDPFRRKRLIKSSERLYDSGLFTSVEIEPVRADTVLGLLDLNVRVRERKPRWVEGGIGVGSQERVRLSGQWGTRNISGKGRALTAAATFGFFRLAQADSTHFPTDRREPLYRARTAITLTEPWLLGARVRGSVTPSYERGFEVFSTRTFVQEAWGLSFGVSRDFTFTKSRVSLVLENTWTTVAKFVEQAAGDTLTPLIPDYSRRWTLAFDQDLRDDQLEPRQGSLTHLGTTLAGPTQAGLGRYLKFEGSTGLHVPSGTRGSFGVRLRAGYLAGIGAGPSGDDTLLTRVLLTDRFRTGGGSSVRGYHENGIDDGGGGGRLMLNANVEWRFPLKGILSGAAFLDGGNVWRRMVDVQLSRLFQAHGVDGSLTSSDMRWSVGGGVRIRTPIGPLRLDYGRRLRLDEVDVVRAGFKPDRGAWHFSIGQLF
jgi:outer membrane protein insertion porin family